MKILILWADDHSPNLGVRVLGRGTAALVQRVWPNAEIEYQNFGSRVAALPMSRIRSLIKERFTGRKGMQDWFRSFDLVVDTRSGDSFTDIYGIRRLALMSTVAEFARQAGTPLVLGPQTIGPVNSTLGRLIARRSLTRANLVMARDGTSAEYAERLGAPHGVLTTDVVFALPVPAVERSRDVVLNVSGLLWNTNPHVDSQRYRRTIGQLHGELSAAGRRVSLLAHVIESDYPDSDVQAVRDFQGRLSADSEVVIPRSLEEMREVAASASVVIGSRMHACLNAISVGTPAIPLAYSRKFKPLFDDLGWKHTIDLRDDPDVAAHAIAAIQLPSLTRNVDDIRVQADIALKRAEEALARLRL